MESQIRPTADPRTPTRRCAPAAQRRRRRAGPGARSGGAALAADGPKQLKTAADALDPCPPDGAPLEQVLDQLAPILDGGIRLGDPRTVAHLHPAPLIPAAAAELAIGVTNQSMDAFDASPAATYVEDALVRWLAREHGLGEARVGRDDDGRDRLEPARPAAGARPRG